MDPKGFKEGRLERALATLAATRFAPDALYTFGSPRVGSSVEGERVAVICRHCRTVSTAMLRQQPFESVTTHSRCAVCVKRSKGCTVLIV